MWTAINSEGYLSPIGLAADAVIFTLLDNRLSVLLAQRHEAPANGVWALPGGFVGPSETPQQTAERKLEEKTGLSAEHVYFEQLRTYAAPERDSRGWLPSVAFLALVPAQMLPEGRSDAAWFAIDRLPTLAFDHAEMVADGLERLRGKLWWSNVAVGLLEPTFTLSQAQAVYEAIADQEYDKANFRRDLKNSGLIVATDETPVPARGRPAQRYRFCSRDLSWTPRSRGPLS
jgi:8-oxo-dGTP diphosphatase